MAFSYPNEHEYISGFTSLEQNTMSISLLRPACHNSLQNYINKEICGIMSLEFFNFTHICELKKGQGHLHENSEVSSMFLDCLMSQQHVSVSQGRICADNFTCCHTETEAADPTFYPTQSQYTDTGPTHPSADPITPGAWQGSHWSANFEVIDMTRLGKIPTQVEPQIFRSRGGHINH